MAGEDPEYSDWVRGQRCCMCGAPPRSEQHHPRGPAYDTGMGKRSHDWYSIALCRGCHHDKLGKMDKWARRAFEFHQSIAHRGRYMAEMLKASLPPPPDPPPAEDVF